MHHCHAPPTPWGRPQQTPPFLSAALLGKLRNRQPPSEITEWVDSELHPPLSLLRCGTPTPAPRGHIIINNHMESNLAVPDPPLHKLGLGFNTGYLSSAPKYTAAFQKAFRDGFDVRIFEPFCLGVAPVPIASVELVASTLALGGESSSMLLDVSNFPFRTPSDLTQHPQRYLGDGLWPGAPGTAKLADEVRYTNRGPVAAWQNGSLSAYSDVLRRLVSQLTARNLSARVSFEIGNEPNALGYFWGNASSFEPIAAAALTALDGIRNARGGVGARARGVRQPDVRCCAFATELSGYDWPPNASAETRGFQSWASGGWKERLPTASLSWHFYRHSANDANPNISTYANASRFYGTLLENSIISEWGLFTYQSPRSTQVMASDALMRELVRLLRFAYLGKVEHVYLECLMDDPSKGGHNCYFDRFGEPRASYGTAALVQRIIEGGYRVHAPARAADLHGMAATMPAPTSSDLHGGMTVISGGRHGLQLLCACGDEDGRGAIAAPFSLPKQWGVVASSDFDIGGGVLPANAWLVMQNETARGPHDHDA
jgi:hypothetical protein